MPEPKHIPAPDADLIFYPNFYSEAEAAELYQQLLQQTEWQQEHIKMFGKEVLVPRLVAWYGEEGAVYMYSGVRHVPLPFTTLLLKIRQKIEKTLQKQFNAVLLNRYRTGSDSMGWHSDNEPELGPEPVIASLSLGATRSFQLRHRQHKDQKIKLELNSGSLLIMAGQTQHFWQHQLPKTSKPVGERINLTFRKIN